MIKYLRRRADAQKMDEQIDSGQDDDQPFEFQTTILPFDLPETSAARRDQPQPDVLDFDAHTVAPHEREIHWRTRYDSVDSSAEAEAEAKPSQTSTSADTTVDLTDSSVEAPTTLTDSDTDDPTTRGSRRGVFAMAGVACVALFMTGVAVSGNGGRTETAPPMMARRDVPVEARAGVADQAFEYALSSHELEGDAVKPVVTELCTRLSKGDQAEDVMADARQRLQVLSPGLPESGANLVIRAGVEARCMEHVLNLG